MRLLALATSGPFAAVGLRAEDGTLDVSPLGAGAERGRGVLVAVEALLAGRGWKPADLSGIAVDVGPGSFTGVRVGVSTAKALALGLSIPVVGVLSLDALAAAAGPPSGETPVPILALRDARAGEAYFALYHPEAVDAAVISGRTPDTYGEIDVPPRRLTRLLRGTAAAIRRALEERGLARALAVGEDAERLAVSLPLRGLVTGVRTPAAGPAEIFRLALPRFLSGATDDPDALAPAYLQPSTPERRLSGDAPPG